MVAPMNERTHPAADADVESVPSILKALYEAVSFRRQEAPAFDRLRSLFHTGARLIPVKPGSMEIMDIEAFIASMRGHLESGALEYFVEREIARRVEIFGCIAHAFSTYETSYALGGRAMAKRGINSIQLLHDGGRWGILTIFWFDESPEHPIPQTYLT